MAKWYGIKSTRFAGSFLMSIRNFRIPRIGITPSRKTAGRAKDQPFYHLLAENEDSFYVAYVSEQNLLPDESGEPVEHPDLYELFGEFNNGRYPLQIEMN